MTVSLASQIAEVERELALRSRVYPGLVRKKKMRQSEADEHTARMQAVLATLKWVRENETAIRASVAPIV